MNTNSPHMETFLRTGKKKTVKVRLKDVDGMWIWHTSYDQPVNPDMEVKLYIDGKLFLHTDIVSLLLMFFTWTGRFPSDKSKIDLFVGGRKVPFKLVEKEER